MKNDETLKNHTNQEFDRLMCTKYPILFEQRSAPMSETCMCWGFEIGPGWFDILNELCEQYQAIMDVTGIKINFQQIKEKYGSARFYISYDCSNHKLANDEQCSTWGDIIHQLESAAEDKTDHICEECGVYYEKKANEGGWIYGTCEKCSEIRNKKRAEHV